MRILMISHGQALPSPAPGYGGEIVVADLVTGLNRLGHEVDFAAPTSSLVPSKGRLIDTGPPTWGWRGVDGADERAYAVYRALMSDVDIVHSNDHKGLVYRARQQGNFSNHVHTLHGLSTWGRTHPSQSSRHTNFLVHTKWHDAITKQLIGRGGRVLPLALDLERYPLRQEKEDWFLCFGILLPHKGHLEAVRLAQEHGLKLKVAGECSFGGVSQSYVQEVKSACAKAGFEFIDSPDQAQKLDLMQRARGLIQPFLRGETWSVLSVEAMACGADVFASLHGGLREMPLRDLGLAVQRNDFTPREPGVVRKLVEPFSCEEVAKLHVQAYRDIMEGQGW